MGLEDIGEICNRGLERLDIDMGDEQKDWVRELVGIMARLRAPDGCPWDREQDHVTLKKYLVEEAYELLDAIDEADDAQMRDELGDVLLQVVFHAQIAAEEERFDLQEVARAICEKLIRRHPHVFGEAEVADAEGVLTQWEAIKKQEAAKKGKPRESALDGIPRGLPALRQAEKIQKKAAKLGFDWTSQDGIIEKLEEEYLELKEALQGDDIEAIHDEIGDMLFVLVNLTRFRGESAEDILRGTVRKFYRRFRYIEIAVERSGKPFKAYTLEELDALWDEAKEVERGLRHSEPEPAGEAQAREAD